LPAFLSGKVEAGSKKGLHTKDACSILGFSAEEAQRTFSGFRIIAEEALNKKLLLPIATLVSSIFFILLGMRIPELDGSHRPKQRLRAVVESSVKDSPEVCKKQIADAGLPLLPEAVAIPAPVIRFAEFVQELPLYSVLTISCFPSRASPFVSSLFC